jgi:hypothetical protein
MPNIEPIHRKGSRMSPKTPENPGNQAPKDTPEEGRKKKAKAPSKTKKAPAKPKKPEPDLSEEAEELDQEPVIPLGEAGRILWDAVAPDLELEDRERALLTLAADQFEELELLKAQIRSEGVAATGYKGQKRTSPHATEARQQRLAIARLLGMLSIPPDDDDSEKPLTETSRRAQHAARARWLKEADFKARKKRARRTDG